MQLGKIRILQIYEMKYNLLLYFSMIMMLQIIILTHIYQLEHVCPEVLHLTRG